MSSTLPISRGFAHHNTKGMIFPYDTQAENARQLPSACRQFGGVESAGSIHCAFAVRRTRHDRMLCSTAGSTAGAFCTICAHSASSTSRLGGVGFAPPPPAQDMTKLKAFSQTESPQKRRPERATGSNTPPILKQEGLEQLRGEEVQSRMSRRNLKTMMWKKSNGGNVCLG